MRQMSLKGLDRPGNEADKGVARKICDRIFGAAHQRVENYARYVRRIVERSGQQRDLYLSDAFNRRQSELIKEINLEWTLDRPDLKRFGRLVADWESLYISELQAELKKRNGPP